MVGRKGFLDKPMFEQKCNEALRTGRRRLSQEKATASGPEVGKFFLSSRPFPEALTLEEGEGGGGGGELRSEGFRSS